MIERQFGVRGEFGHLTWLVDTARELVLHVYASPALGKLHTCVPVPSWPNEAGNDVRYGPNVLDCLPRPGHFDPEGRWIT